jgi:formylglycine-generating enzyme required for sulfatase activity
MKNYLFLRNLLIIGITMVPLVITGCQNPDSGTNPVYSISLDKTGTHTFDQEGLGYWTTNQLAVTVSNTGTHATASLTAALSGTNADGFTITGASIEDIAINGNTSFTVEPKPGLGLGTYAATVTVSGDNDINESFTLSFTVSLPRMIKIPAGTFIPRSGRGKTTISKAYWMGETQVTQELWQAVMGNNPSKFKGESAIELDYNEGEDLGRKPVDNVNWYHAVSFCNKLSLIAGKNPVYTVTGITDWENLSYDDIPTTGNANWDAVVCDWDANGYRLPTDIEWLWAGMGADKGGGTRDGDGVLTNGFDKLYAGHDLAKNSEDDTLVGAPGEYAWYQDNAHGVTHQTGLKLPNELGLYDMSGNVWELCWDWWVNSPTYPAADTTDHRGAANGTSRIDHGGTYLTPGSGTTNIRFSANRSTTTPQLASHQTGFRLAMSE